MTEVACPRCGTSAPFICEGASGGEVDHGNRGGLHCSHCGYMAPPSSANLQDRLPPAGRKALQLLNQPTPLVDEGTHYERRSTPFFVDDCASSPGEVGSEVGSEVGIVVWLDHRRGSYMGDYDDWDRSTTYALPADWFFDVLALLQAGVEVSAQGRAEIIEHDEASGADCEDPHRDVTRKEVQVMLRLELSADMGSVTLTLLRQESGGWAPVTQLRTPSQ